MYCFKWKGGEREKERGKKWNRSHIRRISHYRWPSKFRFLKMTTLFKETEFWIHLFTIYLSLYTHIPGIYDIWRSLNHFLPSGMHQPRKGYGLRQRLSAHCPVCQPFHSRSWQQGPRKGRQQLRNLLPTTCLHAYLGRKWTFQGNLLFQNALF